MYVPTNHIYFGDIHIYSSQVVSYPELSVQDGVKVFLTGGMALSQTVSLNDVQRAGPTVVASSLDPLVDEAVARPAERRAR